MEFLLSIALVSLLLLVIVAVVAVPVVVRAVGSASRRNEQQPGDETESKSDEKQPSDQEIHDEAEAIKRTGPFFGMVAGVSGVLAGLAGGIFGMDEGLLGSAVPATSMGIFLGLAGYVLGARQLGRVAAIFSAVALIFALSASQGYVPGLAPTDHGLPQKEPGAAAGAE
jgi:hypothetical protein